MRRLLSTIAAFFVVFYGTGIFSVQAAYSGPEAPEGSEKIPKNPFYVFLDGLSPEDYSGIYMDGDTYCIATNSPEIIQTIRNGKWSAPVKVVPGMKYSLQELLDQQAKLSNLLFELGINATYIDETANELAVCAEMWTDSKKEEIRKLLSFENVRFEVMEGMKSCADKEAPAMEENSEKRWAELNRIKTELEKVLSPDVYGGIWLADLEEFKKHNSNLIIYTIDEESVKKEVEKLKPAPIAGYINYKKDSISLTEISRILTALEANKEPYGILEVEEKYNIIFIDVSEKNKEAKKFVETLNIKEGHVIFRQDMASMVTGDAPN